MLACVCHVGVTLRRANRLGCVPACPAPFSADDCGCGLLPHRYREAAGADAAGVPGARARHAAGLQGSPASLPAAHSWSRQPYPIILVCCPTLLRHRCCLRGCAPALSWPCGRCMQQQACQVSCRRAAPRRAGQLGMPGCCASATRWCHAAGTAHCAASPAAFDHPLGHPLQHVIVLLPHLPQASSRASVS